MGFNVDLVTGLAFGLVHWKAKVAIFRSIVTSPPQLALKRLIFQPSSLVWMASFACFSLLPHIIKRCVRKPQEQCGEIFLSQDGDLCSPIAAPPYIKEPFEPGFFFSAQENT